MYPPRIWAAQISICAFLAGVFTGGGGLKKQIKRLFSQIMLLSWRAERHRQ